LASGTDVRQPPWVNLDVVKQWPGYPPCNIVWDARKNPIPFDDESVDEVVAGYLLLHIAPQYHDGVLKEIFRVMQPGARLEIGEVDMRVAMERWLADPDDRSANEMIWGEMGFERGNGLDWSGLEEFDKHCCGFTEGKLFKLLEKHGFERFRRYKQHAPEVWYEMSVEVFKP